MKILIIEDDPFFAQSLKEKLEDRGYTTQLVKSVENAISVSTDGISAIISDVMLPNDSAKSGISDDETRAGYLGGVAYFRSLRQKGIKTPLFFLTNSSKSGEAADWAAKEGIPFISKTDGSEAILAALETAGLPIKRVSQCSTIPDSKTGQNSKISQDGEPPDWLKGLIWFRRNPWYLVVILGATLFVYVIVRLTGHDPLCILLEKVGLNCGFETTKTNFVTITNFVSGH